MTTIDAQAPARPSRPATLRRRFMRLMVIGLSLPLLGACVVLFSAWSEHRAPSDAPDRSLMTRVRGTITKPIVDAVGRQIQHHLRSRGEARRRMSGISLGEAITRFLDESRSLSERRVYAYRLAAEGTPEAIAALLTVLERAPAGHKAFMLQLIGSTGNRAVKKHLWPFLADADERVARAAIRGLSAIGGRNVAKELGRILGQQDGPEAMRLEAARGLGRIGTPRARDALVASLENEPGAEVAAQIVDGLGRFPFTRVAPTFEHLVNDADVDSDVRVAAVEALIHSSASAVPFLLDVAGGNADAELRESAAWAAGMQGGREDLGPRLAHMAQTEPEPDVRRRLYEALLSQREIPGERLLPMVAAEQDVAARVAGFNAVGGAVGRDPTTALAAAFDADIVPELHRIAASGNSVNVRMRAVFALRRARTAAARDTLAALATTDEPQVAAAARHGL